MDIGRQYSSDSWFRTRGGRRYGFELGLVIAAKLIALTILYFVFVAPLPRADTSPAATGQHLLGKPSTIQPVSP